MFQILFPVGTLTKRFISDVVKHLNYQRSPLRENLCSAQFKYYAFLVTVGSHFCTIQKWQTVFSCFGRFLIKPIDVNSEKYIENSK